MAGTLDQYLWITIAGGIVGFVYTFGIGANDVANACEYNANWFSFVPYLSY
jgi:hypothetical protein